MHVARRSRDLTATFVDPFTRERNFPFKKKAFVLHMLQSYVYQPKLIARPSPLILGEGLAIE